MLEHRERSAELNQCKRPVIGIAVHLMERERRSLSTGFNLQKGGCLVCITRAKSKKASKGITDVLIITSHGRGGNQDRKRRDKLTPSRTLILVSSIASSTLSMFKGNKIVDGGKAAKKNPSMLLNWASDYNQHSTKV